MREEKNRKKSLTELAAVVLLEDDGLDVAGAGLQRAHEVRDVGLQDLQAVLRAVAERQGGPLAALACRGTTVLK